MIFHKTFIDGLFVIEPERLEDERGFFVRSFCEDQFMERGLEINYPQTNTSYNYRKGTVRGLHFQRKPKSEDKLVTCIVGKIYDVVVDLRKESPTYLKYFGIELTEKNGLQLYVPKGFAHGYQTLVEDSTVFYMVSQKYSPGFESGLLFNDPALGINWPLECAQISKKDVTWPKLTPQ